MKVINRILVAFWLMCSGLNAHGYDSYNAETGQLTIPLVEVDSAIYSDVVITLKDLVSVGVGNFVEPHDVFNTVTQQLQIPLVVVGNNEYSNVVVTIGEVISVGNSLLPLSSECVVESRKYGEISIPKGFLGDYEIPSPQSKLSENIDRVMNLKDLDAWWAKPKYVNCVDKNSYMIDVFIESMDRLKNLGVETFWVYNYAVWEDFSKEVWTISESDFSIPNAVLERIVFEAHSRDMKVFLSWQMFGGDKIEPRKSLDVLNMPLSTLNTLLESFELHIVEYATFLEAIGVDGIAGDLGNFKTQDTPEYRELYVSKTVSTIQKLRKVFSGSLAYGQFFPVLDNRILELIDELHFVLWMSEEYSAALFSVDLTEKTTLGQISRYQIKANEQQASLAFNIPIVWEIYAQSTEEFFLNKGYLEDSFCFEPCSQKYLTENFSMQAIAVEGAMRGISSQNIFKTGGVTATNYWHRDEIIPTLVNGNISFPNISSSIRNKPAEGVFKAWFAR